MDHPGTRSSVPLLSIHLLSVFIQKVAPWLLAIVLILAVGSTVTTITDQDSIWGAFLRMNSNIRVSRGSALVFGDSIWASAA
jgi:hypothetical protein